MRRQNLIPFLLFLAVLFFSVFPVFAGIEDYSDETETAVPEVYSLIRITPEPQPTLSLSPTKTSAADLRAEKIRKNYRDYYFVVEESLRVLEYNAEDYNHAVCQGDRYDVKRLREKLNTAILDADVLMDKLNLYNDLHLWKIYYQYIDSPDCGLDRGLIAETKGAMDRLHRQTEKLGLWVPSTGKSDYMMDNANCAQGLFTAPNGVCLSEKGISSTKFYHSNGYVVECVWPGQCDKINARHMDRCDWLDCN